MSGASEQNEARHAHTEGKRGHGPGPVLPGRGDVVGVSAGAEARDGAVDVRPPGPGVVLTLQDEDALRLVVGCSMFSAASFNACAAASAFLRASSLAASICGWITSS